MDEYAVINVTDLLVSLGGILREATSLKYYVTVPSAGDYSDQEAGTVLIYRLKMAGMDETASKARLTGILPFQYNV